MSDEETIGRLLAERDRLKGEREVLLTERERLEAECGRQQAEYDRQARAFNEVAAATGIRLTWVQLEGFAAGLAACPETVSASEWLEAVWDADGDYEGVVGGAAGAREAARTVLSGRLNDVAWELAEAPEAYWPVLSTNEDTGEEDWAPWIAGFERAMRLRPEAWEAIALDNDADAAGAVGVIVSLYGVVSDNEALSEGVDERMIDLARELIQGAVFFLMKYKIARQEGRGSVSWAVPDSTRRAARKVGRNEPCPCGSGRKYKRCCGGH